jgi:glycosyltransferase involved in cell wall biosynthesis
MLVTVAICTWNRAPLLDKTLTSLASLIIPENVSWELLIVNNASTDGTSDVVQKHVQTRRLPLQLLHQPKSGVSYARNMAHEASRGDFHLWTDDDVIVDEHWMRELLTTFNRTNADIVYGKVEPWWQTGPPRWFTSDFEGHFALLNHGEVEKRMPGPPYLGYTVNCGFRRSSMLQLGKFREDFGFSKNGGGAGEDTEMFIRAYASGMNVVYTPNAIVKHNIPEIRCRKSFYRRRAWNGGRVNLQLILGKSGNAPTLFRIPRYIYRINLSYLAQFLRNLILCRESKQFFFELKLIAFWSLLWNAWNSHPKKQ